MCNRSRACGDDECFAVLYSISLLGIHAFLYVIGFIGHLVTITASHAYFLLWWDFTIVCDIRQPHRRNLAVSVDRMENELEERKRKEKSCCVVKLLTYRDPRWGLGEEIPPHLSEDRLPRYLSVQEYPDIPPGRQDHQRMKQHSSLRDTFVQI